VVELPDGSTDTIRILGVDTPNIAQHHLSHGVVGDRCVLSGVLGRYERSAGGGVLGGRRYRRGSGDEHLPSRTRRCCATLGVQGAEDRQASTGTLRPANVASRRRRTTTIANVTVPAFGGTQVRHSGTRARGHPLRARWGLTRVRA
jgi:hypothetical protein